MILLVVLPNTVVVANTLQFADGKYTVNAWHQYNALYIRVMVLTFNCLPAAAMYKPVYSIDHAKTLVKLVQWEHVRIHLTVTKNSVGRH